MKRSLIIGNWKLNPLSLAQAKSLAAAINQPLGNDVVLCPPSVYLSEIKYPYIGAQDCFWQIKGPYTGQLSAAQLKDLKVAYCLVGHSELRTLGETDEMVSAKIAALIAQGITPVLCVGFGTTIGEDELDVIDVLRGQLEAGLKDVDPSRIVVAYEPVWAIGSGKAATPEHAEKISIFIKTKFGMRKVLYGGSVNSTNAKSFLAQDHIDGLLVGSSSLIPDEFNKIIS
jgi:triosephosphate isomerase (TIM)